MEWAQKVKKKLTVKVIAHLAAGGSRVNPTG